MEKNYLEYINKYLSESAVMDPYPTGLEPKYSIDSTIKAVVFDIYGTIIISASGDIDESVISAENLRTAMDASGIMLSDSLTDSRAVFTEMLDSFKGEINRVHREGRTETRPYPEVDILKIWETILYDFRDKNALNFNGSLCVRCFTFIFELLSNNIFPMPGMKEIINTLAEKKMPLGIISNAQFYTPVILNYFLNSTITEDEEIKPFDKDLTIFSYRHMRSKPDRYLFEMLRDNCKSKYKIMPSEILFVGNDMFRDIVPGHKVGFKTALFAGDSRSLKLRKEKPEVADVSPDYIITGLNQILKIVT